MSEICFLYLRTGFEKQRCGRRWRILYDVALQNARYYWRLIDEVLIPFYCFCCCMTFILLFLFFEPTGLQAVRPGGTGQAVHLNVASYVNQPWLIRAAKQVNGPHIQYVKSVVCA
jgi:hypothetical protein